MSSNQKNFKWLKVIVDTEEGSNDSTLPELRILDNRKVVGIGRS